LETLRKGIGVKKRQRLANDSKKPVPEYLFEKGENGHLGAKGGSRNGAGKMSKDGPCYRGGPRIPSRQGGKRGIALVI